MLRWMRREILTQILVAVLGGVLGGLELFVSFLLASHDFDLILFRHG